jgi:hypothetical protein
MGWDSINWFNPLHVSIQDLKDFQRHMSIVFNWLRCEVVVRFVEIGEIVDNHCLEMTLRFVDFGGIV